jgi:hypothetical protein
VVVLDIAVTRHESGPSTNRSRLHKKALQLTSFRRHSASPLALGAERRYVWRTECWLDVRLLKDWTRVWHTTLPESPVALHDGVRCTGHPSESFTEAVLPRIHERPSRRDRGRGDCF